MPFRAPDNDTTADFAADCLCEFLEAALHCTLHRRGVYPAEAFELVRLYDVPVHRARHPELRDYLATAVGATTICASRACAHAHAPVRTCVRT